MLKIACILCAAMLQTVISVAQPVIKIAAGNWHSLFLKSDGSLWAMGFNGNGNPKPDNGGGQLGDGTYNNTNRPEQVVLSNVTTIAAGEYHSLFLKSDGSLWAMGFNAHGQLGDGTFGSFPSFSTNLPEQIVASNVTAIAGGSEYSLFLKSDGSLWGMGWNSSGQLGYGQPLYEYDSPVEIVASNVIAIAAGAAHSLFLKSDGSLWGMGLNQYGQLGDGTTNNTILPEQIVASNVTTISAGYYHSLFLKSDGSMWAMGFNAQGQLGDGTFNNTNLPEQIVASNVTAIAAGNGHNVFLMNDGSLWAMGDNTYGQLGDGTYNSTNRPEQIVPSNVTAIAVGEVHNLFIKNDGSLWAVGNNGSGQLGDGVTYGIGTPLHHNGTNQPEQIVVNPAYNHISLQFSGGDNVALSYVGFAGTNYVLDRSFSLSPANWVPQVTNSAGLFGALVFTNTLDATTNDFWRIRSVP